MSYLGLKQVPFKTTAGRKKTKGENFFFVFSFKDKQNKYVSWKTFVCFFFSI